MIMEYGDQYQYKTFRMRFTNLICLLVVWVLGLSVLVAQPNIDEGKSLFKAKCAQCHNKNMRDKLTGPPLGVAEDHWADFPREDLYAWIRNSQALISSGHPYANQLFSEWGGVVMNSNADLSDEQIESILAYVQDAYTNVGSATVATSGGGATGQSKKGVGYLWWVIGGLALLALVLTQLLGTLRNVIQAREMGTTAHSVSFFEILTSKSVLSLLMFALIVGLGYVTVQSAIGVGRQQGYGPDQPIKFSHKTHAGDQKIDCQYCHDGARRSKHSIIPATNTCMNCHKAIKVGSKYGTGELTKIFASIGFNPLTDQYIENYDSLSEEEIYEIYSKWMALTYLNGDENATLDRKGEKLVERQWSELKASLTNDLKPQIQGPIEWKRIHSLPDHVFFSHEQHVTAGKLECQTCHGKVEEMEILSQHAPLSMGWCINCHRQTEVAGLKDDNPYYTNTYKSYHDALKSGEVDKITVKDIGGLECQKCHY